MVYDSSAPLIGCLNKTPKVISPGVHWTDVSDAVFAHQRRLSKSTIVGLAGFEPTAPCPLDKAFTFAVVRKRLVFKFLDLVNDRRRQAKNVFQISNLGVLPGKARVERVSKSNQKRNPVSHLVPRGGAGGSFS